MRNTMEAVMINNKINSVGSYYPKHTHANHTLNARWECTVVFKQKYRNVFIRVVAWDTATNKIGTFLAKTAIQGAKIKFDYELISFNKKIFVFWQTCFYSF